MITLWALIEALPQIIQLLQFVGAMVHDREQQGIGRKDAIADALTQAHLDLALADAADQEATQHHAKDPTDAAFDQDYRRTTD